MTGIYSRGTTDMSGFHTTLQLVFLDNCLKLHDNFPLTDFQATSHWVLKANWPSIYFSCYVDIIIVGHSMMAWTDTDLQSWINVYNWFAKPLWKVAHHNMHMDKHKCHAVALYIQYICSEWHFTFNICLEQKSKGTFFPVSVLLLNYLYILGCIWNGYFALTVHL